MTFEVEILKPKIGAAIHVDRKSVCDDDVIQACQQLMEERTLVVFPEIGLSDEQQLELTDRLGSRVYYAANVPGGTTAGSDVYEITLESEINNEPEYVLSTFFWHFDGAHNHAAPPKVSMLASWGLAEKGGQTEFANTYAAWDALPDEEKAELEGLRVKHSIISSMRPFAETPSDEERRRWIKAVFNTRLGEEVPADCDSDDFEKEHPLVWTHASGRISLVLGVSADRIVGMPLAEGRALISRLMEWTVQPDFTYRHTWRKGDLVIFDNPGALHRVLPYGAGSGRVMHRTTVTGVELIA
ncbi:MAG: TauD/TfdA family dioxygenase [Novosphingobium sp.]|nr:TauD/TfdA family dioxygenase [Novosphingobium sp.]